MKHRTFIQESVSLAATEAADGSYPVVLITEGDGSTGRYSADLLERSGHVFDGVVSFMNHPIDPERPDKRDVLTIAGRFGAVTVGEDNGRRALLSTFTPRTEYASFFKQFADVLGLSVYCPAEGTLMEDGRLDVENFILSPYRSVDIVVAPGRGGRIKQARESLLVIESSLGTPEGTKPGTTPAPGTHTQEEHHMDPKDLEAITKAMAEALTSTLAPVVTALAEQKTLLEGLKAGAPAATPEVTEKSEVVKSTIEALNAIKDAKLLPTLEKALTESLERGEDVTKGIEFAKTVTAEAAAGKGGTTGAEGAGYVQEGAADKHDFTIAGLIGV